MKKNRIAPPGIVCIGFSVLWMSCTTAVPPGKPVKVIEEVAVDALTVDPRTTVGTLSNGLTYMLRSNHRPEDRLELRLVVRAGSVLEEENQRGLAHYLEHMAFNGTEHFEKNELVDYLESIGMTFGPDINAYTSFDETVLMLQVPTTDHADVETAFQILADWAQGISLDSEEIERERGVIIEEWRLRRGADQRIRDKQLPVLFQGSRYAERIPIGVREVLDSFDPDLLRKFYRDWYRPELMAVIAVGDVEVDVLQSMVKDYFSSIPASVPNAPGRRVYDVPDHTDTRVSIVTDPEATANTVSVYFKRAIDPIRTRRDYRRELMKALFLGMFNRRLDELRQQPDPPFLTAFAYQGELILAKAAFALGARVEDNGVYRGLDAVLLELERVERHGFTETELDRARQDLLRAIRTAYNERETTESARFASDYIEDITRNTISPGIEAELEMSEVLVPGIPIEEVNRFADAWIREDNRVILVTGPDKSGVIMPEEGELLALFDEMPGRTVEAYVDDVGAGPLMGHEPAPGEIADRTRIDELDVTRWKLSNGIEVILKPTDFKQDEVLFSAFSPGGHSLVVDEDFIPASSATTAMMESGLGTFSQVQLEKELAGKIVRVGPFIGELQEGLQGGCAPEDLETLFRLIHLWFTEPRADPAAFESLQDRLRASLKNRLADPEAVFGDRITEVMSRGHLRRKPWTPETVDQMDLNQSLELYRERFADADDFVFLLVGSFDFETVEPLVETYLATLPVVEGDETWIDHDIRPPEGSDRIEVRKVLEPRAAVRVIFTGPMTWNFDERLRISSMIAALNIRLRETIREDLGGTYSASAYHAYNQYPVPEFRITIAFGCAPDQVKSLLEAVDKELESIRSEPLDDLYLTKVKEGQLRRRETDLKTNSFWQYVLQFHEWNGEDPLQILEFDAAVDALRAEDIQETAERYFSTPNRMTFVLLPESEEDSAPPDEDAQSEPVLSP